MNESKLNRTDRPSARLFEGLFKVHDSRHGTRLVVKFQKKLILTPIRHWLFEDCTVNNDRMTNVLNGKRTHNAYRLVRTTVYFRNIFYFVRTFCQVQVW